MQNYIKTESNCIYTERIDGERTIMKTSMLVGNNRSYIA